MTESMSPTEERSPDAREINLAQKIRLLKRLQKLSQLRQEVVVAEIPKREKSRAVGFARNRVRDCDNRFMRELRILVGQGRLQGFEELMHLASQLQDARDSLGPIEQESIDLDQEWEWQASELAEAEQDFYEKFHEEFHEDFQEAAGLPSGSLSSASSDYQASPQFANSYLGDDFENPEDARYGELPTSESITHECSTPTLLETMSLQQTEQINTSSVDAAATSSVPPYDQALEEIVLNSGNNIHQEEETRAFSASTEDETDCHGSEISASEELNHVPEDSITGGSLTAMERISVWLIQTSIFSRWDAYLVKWRFMFEDKELVPTWVVLDIILAQSKSLPKKYDRCGAGDFLLSVPGATSPMAENIYCDDFTPPSSITEVDAQPKPLPRHSLAKLPEEQEGSAIYEPASQDNAIASAIGVGSSYNLGSTATEEKSHVPVDHSEILSDNNITTKTDTPIDQIVTQAQYIRTSDDVQKVCNGQKNPQLIENNATTFNDPEQDTNIPHSLDVDVNQDKTMKGNVFFSLL
ncbi:hypothetical protein ACMFMF_009493 [Clarireedia jacksonii]